jgi:V-type H+-transporting ATPase subunit D
MLDFNLTGLSRGGQQVQKARDTYIKAVGTLVELASLQVGLSVYERGPTAN